jgi:sigma-E factor negative regulatory protein RseB
VSRRLVVVSGTATCATVLALSALSFLGTSEGVAAADGWTGWTGQVDTTAVSDRAAMTPDDDVAVRLLARSGAAASTVSYAGVAVTWDSSGTVSTDLTHLPGMGTIAMPHGGSPAQAKLAPDGRSGSFADDGRALTLLRDNYRVLRAADLDATIAGRPADAVVAVDAAGVLLARYWLDRATGLLLRKELLDTAGAVRQRTGFTEIAIGAPQAVVLPATTQDPWTESLSGAALAEAHDAGCPCPDALPGGLQLLEARRAPAGTVSSTPVVHQLFSDGLVTASLFSLAGSLSADDVAGLQSRGFRRMELAGSSAWVHGAATAMSSASVVWECHGSVLTLVTDDAVDPMGTAAAVLAAFPADPDPAVDSFWSRVQRGWTRLTGRAA